MKVCVSVICKSKQEDILPSQENTDRVSIFSIFIYLGPIFRSFFWFHSITEFPVDTMAAIFWKALFQTPTE